MNLYNMGFACGLFAMMVVPILTAFGDKPDSVLYWSTGLNFELSLACGALCVVFILIGTFGCGDPAWAVWAGYRRLLSTTGRAPNDYLRMFGAGPVMVNIGINGLILPDVPYEEKEEFEPICKKYGLDLISMIAPTSDHRIAMVAKEATGFIYVVSSLGVTGVRSEIKTDIGALVEQIRAVTDVPCAVGFGISEPEQAKKMAGLSDGAIVGSAVVKRIAKYGKDCVPYVAEYVKEMKQADALNLNEVHYSFPLKNQDTNWNIH